MLDPENVSPTVRLHTCACTQAGRMLVHGRVSYISCSAAAGEAQVQWADGEHLQGDLLLAAPGPCPEQARACGPRRPFLPGRRQAGRHPGHQQIQVRADPFLTSGRA